MKDIQRRKYEKFNREVAFMTDNAASFPTASPGKVTVDALGGVLNEIEALGTTQASGASSARMSGASKDDALEELLALIRKINRAANAMEDAIPNIDQMFRLPRNRSEQNLLIVARQFQLDAESHEATFVEYGLPAAFIADLGVLITAIETSIAVRDTAAEQSAGATGGLIDAFRRASKLSNKLDSIVRIKFADNAQKLASWTVASHLERAPQSPTPPAPPQP